MKKFLLLGLLFVLLAPFAVKAQFESFKDSVVQLYGVVMTADSLRGLDGVSVSVSAVGGYGNYYYSSIYIGLNFP